MAASNHFLSVELQNFLARYIHSVEQLEILCLLVEAPSRAWKENELLQRIQSSAESVSANLRYFTEERLMAGDKASGYRFSTENAELSSQAVALVKTYRERRVTIIEAIYQKPLDPIRHFADAFRIRKDRP